MPKLPQYDIPTAVNPAANQGLQANVPQAAVNTFGIEQNLSYFNLANKEVQDKYKQIEDARRINQQAEKITSFIRDGSAKIKELETLPMPEAQAQFMQFREQNLEALLSDIVDPVEKAQLQSDLVQRSFSLEKNLGDNILARQRDANKASMLASIDEFSKIAAQSPDAAIRKDMMQNISDRLAASVAAGDIDAVQAYEIGSNSKKNIQLSYLNGIAANGNPYKALQLLANKEYSDGLDANTISQLKESYIRDGKRLESEARSKTYGNFILRITKNEDVTEDEILKSNLEDTQKAYLLSNVQKAQEEKANNAAIITAAIAGNRKIDVTDKNERKALDQDFALWGAKLAEQRQAEGKSVQPQDIVQYIYERKAVPTQIKDAVATGILYGSKEEAALQLDYVDRISKLPNGSEYVEYIFKDNKNANDVYSVASIGYKAGQPAAEAIAQARKDVFNIPQEVRIEREKEANKILRDKDTQIFDLSDYSEIFTFGENAVADPSTRTDIQYDLENMFKQAYKSTGNFDASVNQAKEKISALYGISEINGNSEVVKQPIEKSYPEIPVSKIREEIISVAKVAANAPSNVSFGDNLFVFADDKTVADKSAGNFPSYPVYSRTEYGSYVPLVDKNGVALRYLPDIKQNAIEKRAKEILSNPREIDRYFAGEGKGKEGKAETNWFNRKSSTVVPDHQIEWARNIAAQEFDASPVGQKYKKATKNAAN